MNKILSHITSQRAGFTIPEIIVILGFLAVLYGLISINPTNRYHKVSLLTTIDGVASDLSIQQIRAMQGDLGSLSSPQSYGIRFAANQYTLFHSNSYAGGDPNNLTITLNPNFTFSSINLPSSQVVFALGSGAFSNYVAGQNTVVLTDQSTGQSYTLRINNYGVLEAGY